MAKKKQTSQQLFEAIRELALGYPEATEDHPWGETAIKVNGKVFLFLGISEIHGGSFSVKLPQSRDIAMDLPFAEPTHYGLGKHGWVTVKFGQGDVPLDLIKAWVDESYRAIAPKKLVKTLG